MTYIKILPQNTNFCMKKHKFRMIWLEKYMYCLFEGRKREQIFFDIYKGKKSINKVLLIFLDNSIL